MKLDLPIAQVLRMINALETVAHDIAGHSQAPDLIRPDDTQEWHDARQLRECARMHTTRPRKNKAL